MLEIIQQKQSALQEQRMTKQRLTRRLQKTEEKLHETTIECERLHRQLTKEQQDVAKLGKFSIAKLFSEWTGSWDEKMKKELEEAAEAEMKYNEAKKMETDLKREVEKLRERLDDSAFLFIEDEWNALLNEKETWIRLHDSEKNRTLHKIADDRVRVQSLIREISEAYEAGEKAERALAGAMKKLDSAEGMSVWDTFLGGGLFVSALKYSEINSSDDLIHKAQRALRRYETELMDVQDAATESFQVNKNDIFTFTDLFFDNIFSDFVVHNRITDAKKKLHAVMQEVRRVQERLARKRAASEEEIRRLDQQQKDIIMA